MRAGLTRERLIAAGAELADAVGFEQVTLSALARQFGVQVASLYSHLENSEALRVGIALVALDRLADRAAEAVAGRSGRDALVALGNAHRDFAHAHPGLFTAARMDLPPELAARSGGVRVAQMTRAVLRGYELPEAEEVHAVRLLGSVFLGFATLERSGSFGHSGPDPGLSWQQGLSALDAMLRHWPTAS